MEKMSGGEWFVFIFVGLAFIGGVYGGIRLFRANQRDRERMKQRNEERTKNEE